MQGGACPTLESFKGNYFIRANSSASLEKREGKRGRYFGRKITNLGERLSNTSINIITGGSPWNKNTKVKRGGKKDPILPNVGMCYHMKGGEKSSW